jgi:hypothetical protein
MIRARAYLECAKRKVFSRCCFILLFFFPCPFPVVSIVTGFKYIVDAAVVMRAAEDSIGCTPTCSSSAVYYIEMDSIQPDKSNPWHLSGTTLAGAQHRKHLEQQTTFIHSPR